MPTTPLPANADLGKLRDTAKLLRDLVRDGDAGAIAMVVEHHPRIDALEPGSDAATRFPLSSAQLVLARHHGYPSWPALHHHVELRRGLARSPHTQAVGAELANDAERADELLRLACLTYGDADRTRPERARELLDRHPELSGATLHTAAATGDAAAAAALLGRPGAAPDRPGGPHDWPPLLYATYSRLPGADTLPVARLLLDAGADPNAGYLWDGLVPPFTALTGALGGGERREPPHPRSLELAGLLLDAGAEANDAQTIYNRGMGDIPSDDTEFLELLLAHGLGRGDGGPWYRLLAPAMGEPADLLTEVLHHAAEQGLVRRARLVLAHGADPNGRCRHPVFGGRTLYQAAVAGGHAEIVAVLEEAGADPATVEPAVRLAGALVAGDAPAVDRIIAADGSLLARLRSSHPDLMRRVAELDRPGAVPLLVRHGFDVNAAWRGRTALHEAAFAGHADCVDALLAAGADPTPPDDEHNSTPQGWAAFAGHEALAARLADAEAEALLARRDGGEPAGA